MNRAEKSLLTESEGRKEALCWFLSHGVEPNLAEDMTQEVLLRLFRCQRRQQENLPARNQKDAEMGTK
jgi:DNA-directed RNA polymerase specialized sigma24 family protein